MIQYSPNLSKPLVTYPVAPGANHTSFTILGLTKLERNILIATWKMGRDLSSIARAVGVPRTSLLYTLKKLQKRGLVKLVYDGGGTVQHQRGGYWKCELPRVIRHFRALAWPRL